MDSSFKEVKNAIGLAYFELNVVLSGCELEINKKGKQKDYFLHGCESLAYWQSSVSGKVQWFFVDLCAGKAMEFGPD